MNSEIIAVGTEILLGDICNTHAQFLSQELASLGINVLYHTAVGDNRERLRQTVQRGLDRSDLIVFTGGLGPTTDDLTKETVCELFGLELRLDVETQQRIEDYFSHLGREMPRNNLKQAMVPENARLFPNENGTAPGLAVQKAGKCVILLPGPPRELVPMYRRSVRPFLEQFMESTIVSHNIRLFGIGESKLDELLGELTENENPTVALYAKRGEVLARVTAKAASVYECERLTGEMIARIEGIAGEYVYGIDVDSLEQVVVRELIQKGKTLALAESCTGGLIAQKITSVPGASGCFEYGLVSYSNRVKAEQLGVNPQLIANHGVVSPQVAQAMAASALRNGRADIGIGVTGIAGPDGGTPEKPVGLVYLGVAVGNTTRAVKLNLGRGLADDRGEIRYRAALHALDLIRRTLCELE